MDNNIRALAGVVIDPGHGGSDSGAIGNGQQEKDYTLKISQYMKDRFRELGIPVTLTRETDETLTPNERTQKILNAYGNNPNVIVISNHLNAGGGTGAEVIYALRNTDTLSRNVLNNLGAEGLTMRKYYQRRLPSDTSKDYYFIHRNTGNTEPIIVEYGFIDDNPENVRFLNDNYKRLAEAVIRAVMTYKGLPYTAPLGFISNTYMVEKGDSLYSIARKYNTTADELKELNNLVSNTLQVGQILRVPSKEEDTPNVTTYLVKQGDSLYSIARRYNTTVDNIKRINNLTSNTISINQVLKLADNNIDDNQSNNVNNQNSNIYIVKSGDSLYSIARKFNTTVNEIKELNDLTSNLLNINQQILLPNSSLSQTTYTVAKGDNLYSIARKFNTTVNDLKQLNNLSSNLLSIGQKLIIS